MKEFKLFFILVLLALLCVSAEAQEKTTYEYHLYSIDTEMMKIYIELAGAEGSLIKDGFDVSNPTHVEKLKVFTTKTTISEIDESDVMQEAYEMMNIDMQCSEIKDEVEVALCEYDEKRVKAFGQNIVNYLELMKQCLVTDKK